MQLQFKMVFDKYNIIHYAPLIKGFSNDKKYELESRNGKKYVLRVSDISLYEKKKNQFELLQKLEKLNINCSRLIDFGRLDDKNCFMLLSWLDGVDGKDAIKDMSEKEAYFLGIEAGQILRKLHNISIDEPTYSWWDKYQEKIDRKINNLLECEYKIPMQEELLRQYKESVYLMKNRPLVFSHGDYHLGNMVVSDGKIGIIDFDKNTIADPYDELKPFCWNVMVSEFFETGLINGYFNNNVPNDFFKILKFYAIESMISHLPWAIKFGKEETEVMNQVNDYQMKWWGNFELDIPTWYKGIVY